MGRDVTQPYTFDQHAEVVADIIELNDGDEQAAVLHANDVQSLYGWDQHKLLTRAYTLIHARKEALK